MNSPALKTGLDTAAMVNAVKGCLPPGRARYGLHEPCFSGNEWRYVKDCIDTGWVSSVGQYVEKFEKGLQDFLSIPYAVAVVNGTSALHLALRIAGVEANDEVLVPDLTFVATANAVAYCGAVPHFVDIEESSMGVDPEKLRKWLKTIGNFKNGELYHQKTGRCIKALIVLHAFGHPADLDRLAEVCQEFRLTLIEDAAEGLGSYYKNRHVGHWGKISVLSFNGNKIVTTGGGGAIVTHDPQLAQQARHLSTTAKVPHPWNIAHDETGFNYRMPNLNAALGLGQLEKMPFFLKKKRELAEAYRKALEAISGVSFFSEPQGARSNYWLSTFILAPEYRGEREKILAALNENNIQARPAWTLMHKLRMYASCPRMKNECAEDLETRILNLPSSVYLS